MSTLDCSDSWTLLVGTYYFDRSFISDPGLLFADARRDRLLSAPTGDHCPSGVSDPIPTMASLLCKGMPVKKLFQCHTKAREHELEEVGILGKCFCFSPRLLCLMPPSLSARQCTFMCPSEFHRVPEMCPPFRVEASPSLYNHKFTHRVPLLVTHYTRTSNKNPPREAPLIKDTLQSTFPIGLIHFWTSEKRTTSLHSVVYSAVLLYSKFIHKLCSCPVGAGCGLGHLQWRVTASTRRTETQETIATLSNPPPLHLPVLSLQWGMMGTYLGHHSHPPIFHHWYGLWNCIYHLSNRKIRNSIDFWTPCHTEPPHYFILNVGTWGLSILPSKGNWTDCIPPWPISAMHVRPFFIFCVMQDAHRLVLMIMRQEVVEARGAVGWSLHCIGVSRSLSLWVWDFCIGSLPLGASHDLTLITTL